MKKTIYLIAFLVLCSVSASYAQDNVKTGWTFGALPSVAYNTDIGFQYGALGEIYYYGDGSTFPQYQHLIYVEAAYTTKNSGQFRLFYDSNYLIPGVRLTFDMTYIPEKMSQFYGFNGYQAVYMPAFEDSKDEGNTDYISRAFYRTNKDAFRVSADFQGTIAGNLFWNAGAGFFTYRVDPVDVAHLNKGKKPEKQLPEVPGLYDLYQTWGIIKPNEAHGGNHPFVRAGLTYDSRNKPNNPSKGIWADAFVTYYGAFGDQKEYNQIRLNASLRHYIPLWKDNLIFAYRLGYQGTLYGDTPFYMMNHFSTLYTKRANYELLGGANSMRGVMRNRIAALGYAYANAELRLKLFSFRIARQNFYVGINPFFDAGVVTQESPLNVSEQELKLRVAASLRNWDHFFSSNTNPWHTSAGAGLKIAMNENFVLSIDYARALNKQDGVSGTYILIGYMF